MKRPIHIRLGKIHAIFGLVLFIIPMMLLIVLWILLPLDENIDVQRLHRAYWTVSAIVIAVMTVAVSLIAVLARRHYVDPLVSLSRRALDYAEGVPVLVKERYLVREIDDLAVAVNDLMDTVMIREESLHQLNESLEEKVKNRTRAHEDTIEILQSARDQLLLSEKMAALGGLVSGVAHEINTPLSISVTAASFLNERTRSLYAEWDEQALTQENLERYLKDSEEGSRIIQTNLDQAARIINSLKQVAVDQQLEESREFELGSYLDDIVLSLKHQLKPGRHTITTDCSGVIMVETYPGVLTRILNNLVFNSVAHAFDKREGGRIFIKARLEGDEVVMDYRDDGRGLTDEEYRKIFDQFFTTRRGRGGTGLGMNIVRDLVKDKLNGTISVAPPDGGGAAFTIRFPADRIPDTADREPAAGQGGTQ